MSCWPCLGSFFVRKDMGKPDLKNAKEPLPTAESVTVKEAAAYFAEYYSAADTMHLPMAGMSFSRDAVKGMNRVFEKIPDAREVRVYYGKQNEKLGYLMLGVNIKGLDMIDQGIDFYTSSDSVVVVRTCPPACDLKSPIVCQENLRLCEEVSRPR